MTPLDSVFSILQQLNHLMLPYIGKVMTKTKSEKIASELEQYLSPLNMRFSHGVIIPKEGYYEELMNSCVFYCVNIEQIGLKGDMVRPREQIYGTESFNSYLNRLRTTAIQQQINEQDAEVAKINESLIQAKEKLRTLIFKMQEIR